MRQKPSPPDRTFGKDRPVRVRRNGIHPALFYGSFAALFAANVVTLVALLMAPDIAGLVNGENERVIAAYEDRIAQLRIEIDRLHSRHYAQAGDVNLQLQELSQQQELLLEQHQYVRRLAEQASELGIEAAQVATGEPAAPPVPVAAAGSAADDDIAAAAQAINQMLDDSRLALSALSGAATQSTDAILGELQTIGIRPQLPGPLPDAVGGPYLPPGDAPDAPGLLDEANAVAEALARFKAARGALAVAPIHPPLDGVPRTSSGFGNRMDPFTRGRAFHSGLDFPAATGTLVLSAGFGRVTFVGRKSGYGNVVEITHDDGLVTRYAHLSGFIAKEGQLVRTGMPVARVGSTGRSTGPHLHFEVRRNDRALDPARFLAAGRRLARFMGV